MPDFEASIFRSREVGANAVPERLVGLSARIFLWCGGQMSSHCLTNLYLIAVVKGRIIIAVHVVCVIVLAFIGKVLLRLAHDVITVRVLGRQSKSSEAGRNHIDQLEHCLAAGIANVLESLSNMGWRVVATEDHVFVRLWVIGDVCDHCRDLGSVCRAFLS